MKKKTILILLGIIAILAAIFIMPLASAYFQGMKKVSVQKEKAFYVPSDSTIEQVSSALLSQGVISDAKGFLAYAKKRNLTNSTLEPGKYLIKPNQKLSDLVVGFRKGYAEKEVKITFNNARTKKDFAEKITANIELTSEDFLNYIKDTQTAKKYGFNNVEFTTMFIPDTYRVYWDVSREELLKKLAKAYKKFWTPTRKSKAKKMGLTQAQVTTLASIVYAETKKKTDAPIVAGVYVNRLRKGMPLQADPTLIWALGDFSVKRVLNKDKELDSPYNTYKNAGLPPGPIYIPSTPFLDAVLNYQKHDYYYFCAKEDLSGDTNFAKTLSQHNVNARKYQNALNKRKMYR